MKVIKAYELVENRRLKGEHLPYDAELAIAHFRSFFVVGSSMIHRVTDEYAKNVMKEVLETLLHDLK